MSAVATVAILILFSPWTHAVAQQQAVDTVISDVATWSHPVKTVLQKNKVKLEKVEITADKKQIGQKYFVFYVSLPYDPQSSATTAYYNKLYTGILETIGESNYALQDKNDRLRIEIGWNKAKKSLSVNFVPLE
jgi:hypothetical protein